MIFSNWRRLTENEVRMAKQVFVDSIDFNRIKIYRGIPFLPNPNTAIAPMEIYISRANTALMISLKLASPTKSG